MNILRPTDINAYFLRLFSDFYESQLFFFIIIPSSLIVVERFIFRKSPPDENSIPSHSGDTDIPVDLERKSDYATLKWAYLVVYSIVIWADWLQGPYIYSLYREEHGLSERQVASLFAIGFSSAGITAPFIGASADQYGRRRLCLLFCITYSLSCLFTLSGLTIPLLVLGRFLGGVSTSILFSVFESWLITSALDRNLSDKELSRILGTATFLNGFLATVAGLFSNYIVDCFHSYKAPFYASGISLLLGWVMIQALWNENYASTTTIGFFQAKRLREAVKILRQDASLITLVLVQTCFEGVMYLFVFSWVSLLQELPPVTGTTLPLGYIFSCYMVSMIFGSLVYNIVVSSASLNPLRSNLSLHAILSICITVFSACFLILSIRTTNNRYRFRSLCGFEACVGLYYPVQGILRSIIVHEDHRATLNALARVPLNIFVVIMLLTGTDGARHHVFLVGAGTLLLSAIMTALVILRQPRPVFLAPSPEEQAAEIIPQ